MIDRSVRIAIVGHALLFVGFLLALASQGYTPDVLDAAGWWVPFLVVNAGILVGNISMAWLGNAPDPERIVAAGRREDLEHGRDVVVEQLRTLDAERDKLAPGVYEAERTRLASLGAATLRELEEAETSPGSGDHTMLPLDALTTQLKQIRAADPSTFDAAIQNLGIPTRGMSGEWRGAGYTLVTFGLVAALWWLATGDARDRQRGASMTGGDEVAPMSSAEAPEGEAQPDPRVLALEKKIAETPGDIALLNDLTELQLARQDLGGALDANNRALEAAPDDVDAAVFRAVLRAFIGKRDEAMAELDQILVKDPKQLRALVYLGLLTVRSNPEKSADALSRALAIEDSPQLRQALGEAQRLAAIPPDQREAASAAPAPAPAAPAAGGAPSLLASGTITLADPSKKGAVLFVSIQGAGGPPLAALKLAPGPFPMTFELTTANLIPMMAGRPLPPTFAVVARLDADGDPMTGRDVDPMVRVEGVTAGTNGMALKLP